MNGARIGIFAHSTNPRGGVVHAMHLADALCDAGQQATLLAPAGDGGGFFRTPRCPTLLIPGIAAPADVPQLVRTRRREIAAFLQAPGAPRFDLLHAQDSISALALSDLVEAGAIHGYLRTVHHLDAFSDPALCAWQDRGVQRASALFCVSRVWQSELRLRFGRGSVVVGNGVDGARFSPVPDPADAALRRRLLPQGGRMLLALGGVEARKNTLGTLRAFLRLLRDGQHPDLHLVIAGGASLLDHAAARAAFADAAGESAHANRIIIAGVIEDREMPSLYRNAEMLCFPSLREGFGLCVLEAMASGIPVLVPRGAPFDEYLDEDDAIFVDPTSDLSMYAAIRGALHPDCLRQAAARGPRRARAFGWDAVAARHLPVYDAALTREKLHA